MKFVLNNDKGEQIVGIDKKPRLAARLYPDKTAIEFGQKTLTYRELDRLSSAVAAEILNRTGENNTKPVAIYASRSIELILALLGTVRAGRPFAILDSSYPADKIRSQLEQITPDLIIGTDLSEVESVFGYESPAKWNLRLDEIMGVESLTLSSDIPYSTIAYLLFTSGTTGTSKCISTRHEPLLHFIDFYKRTFEPGQDDSFSMLSGLGHDPLLRDVFVPLSIGAKVCIPSEEIVRQPQELYKWLLDSGVTYMHTTPQLIRLVNAGGNGQKKLENLSYIFSGGDRLNRNHVEAIKEVAPNAIVVNFYGSSETPQAVGYHVVDDDDIEIPVGKGIDDVHLLVLNNDMEIAGVEEEGQICVESSFLSEGYLENENETKKKFVASPFEGNNHAKIYLTGDYGHYRRDGAVVFTGRKDDQVKIRGYRVELCEVTKAMEDTGLVSNAALLVTTNTSGENQLVAFGVEKKNVSVPGKNGLEARMREALAARLPAYMIPVKVLPVNEMPLTPNGKVDKNVLEKLFRELNQSVSERIRDDGHIDERLRSFIATIENVLGFPVDDTGKSFVDLGGDSLSYIRASMVIEKHLGYLPDAWEKKPLIGLYNSKIKKDTSRIWTSVKVPVLLRSITIVTVILSHIGVIDLAGAAVLFVLSGISFGRFLRPAILQKGTLKGVFSFILRYGIPASLWQLMRSISFRHFWLPDLLLMGTLWQKPGDGTGIWFIDILTACLLIMSAFAFIEYQWRSKSEGTRSSSNRIGIDTYIVLLTMVLAIIQVSTGWWNGVVGRDNVGPFHWLWLVAFGLAISQMSTRRHYWLMTGLLMVPLVSSLLALPVVSAPFKGLDALFYLSILLVIWVDNIPVPRFVRGVIVEVASASLFIYITHYVFISKFLPHFGIPPLWPVQTVAGVIIGVIVNRLWNIVIAVFAKLVKKRNMRCNFVMSTSTEQAL